MTIPADSGLSSCECSRSTSLVRRRGTVVFFEELDLTDPPATLCGSPVRGSSRISRRKAKAALVARRLREAERVDADHVSNLLGDGGTLGDFGPGCRFDLSLRLAGFGACLLLADAWMSLED
jgi:hypothetical protein